jgi:oligopeptidase A
MTSSTSNPLLNSNSLPDFNAISELCIESGIPLLLAKLEKKLLEIETKGAPTWEQCVEPLALIQDELHRMWGIVTHLMAVKNSEELRKIYAKMQGQVVQFSLRISQSQRIYKLLTNLESSSLFDNLSEPQQRLIHSWILSAKQGGVGLAGEASERFNKCQEDFSRNAVNFGNHVLDDLKKRGIPIAKESDLEGVPELVLKRSALKAQEVSSESQWFISVDPSIARAFQQNCKVRSLREALHRESMRVASKGEEDNNPVIDAILNLRKEQSALLGYANTADMYLEPKMAKNVETALAFLEELFVSAGPKALNQVNELQNFAKLSKNPIFEGEALQVWDVSFWSERLRESQLGFSAEMLRPYFPFNTVLEGFFTLINRVFGLKVKLAEQAVSVWHPDVRYYTVTNEQGAHVGSFYLDAYVRPENKRGGAWMGICQNSYKLSTGEKSLPVTYVVCNQSPPHDGVPSLMSFEEVTTLFHEFGHALHHMVAEPAWIGASPLEISEWDSVEIASQFMESWCYEPEVLELISGHYQTGEKLPAQHIQGLQKTRTFLKAIHIVRQLHFALTDLTIYSTGVVDSAVAHKIYQTVGARVRELPPLADDQMLCAFSHIFGGGYAAGYYSYLWSEVLSVDLFSEFHKKVADESSQEWWNRVSVLGRKFRDEFLSVAGAINPTKAFYNFKGREPQPTPFLRQYDLL